MIEQLPLEDAYPNARGIVAFNEESHRKDSLFWRTMREDEKSIDYVIGLFRSVLPSYRPDLMEEINTLDFRRYVAAKLGMM